MLLLLGILMSIVFLLVASAFLVGCALITHAIQEIDLNAISVILDAAQHSAINVEGFTEQLNVAVTEGVAAINETTHSLVRLNSLLASPRMTVSLN
jgi:type III secretory pathway lipoprotein EscJ